MIPPYLRFVGPSAKSSISCLNASSSIDQVISIKDDRTGSSNPVLNVSTSEHAQLDLTITKIIAGELGQILGTASSTSLSGKITLLIAGQEIVMETDLMSVTGAKIFEGPSGGLKWKIDHSGFGYNLFDEQGLKLATYNFSGSEPELDILVPVEIAFADLIVLSGLAMAKMDKKDTNQMLDVVQQMLSGGALGC